VARDIVQDVFVDVWQRKEQINLSNSIQAYLRKAVVFKTIDHLRKKKKYNEPIDDLEIAMPVIDSIEIKELSILLDNAVEALPPRCRQIFVLSRYEKLSHKEIATELNISKKTIENQITKALKHLYKIVQKYKTD